MYNYYMMPFSFNNEDSNVCNFDTSIISLILIFWQLNFLKIQYQNKIIRCDSYHFPMHW